MAVDNSKNEVEILTFKNLEDGVINPEECCACGACVAYCSSQNFDVIKMDGYTPKFKTNKSEENCKECGICYYICPQTKPLLRHITEAYQIKDELGPVLDIMGAKTTNETIKEIGQDGGMVTTIFTYLFDKKLIDAAIVSEYDDDLKPVPKIVYNKEELLKSSGTRYSISSNILPLKDLYTIAEEILKKHKEVFDINQLRLAFVGTPCQCRAIRKMHQLKLSAAQAIKYVFGLFCMENFDYDKLFTLVKSETNEIPTDITKMNIKKNFYITNKEKKVYEVELKKFDDAVRSHCHSCDEFTARFSDVSFGGSGAVKQNSMVIVRTEQGQNLIESAIADGYIEKFVPKTMTISEWKGKKLSLLSRMTKSKTNK